MTEHLDAGLEILLQHYGWAGLGSETEEPNPLCEPTTQQSTDVELPTNSELGRRS